MKIGLPDPKGYIPNCYIIPVVEKVWFRGEIKVVPSTLRMKSTSFFSLGTADSTQTQLIGTWGISIYHISQAMSFLADRAVPSLNSSH